MEFVDPVFIKDTSRDEIAEWKYFLQALEVGRDDNMIRK